MLPLSTHYTVRFAITYLTMLPLSTLYTVQFAITYLSMLPLSTLYTVQFAITYLTMLPLSTLYTVQFALNTLHSSVCNNLPNHATTLTFYKYTSIPICNLETWGFNTWCNVLVEYKEAWKNLCSNCCISCTNQQSAPTDTSLFCCNDGCSQRHWSLARVGTVLSLSKVGKCIIQ